jgi:hypothetical protein
MKNPNFVFLLLFTILILQLLVCLPVFGQTTGNRGVGPRTGEKRLALVIGNAAYQNTSTLNNTVNDANDMASTLREVGFEVIIGTDQSKREMESLIRRFGERLAEQKGIGLFYYSGHGVQSNNKNYLIPIDADIPTEDEISYQSVDVGLLLGKMGTAENDVNLVILDACRNNPFAKQWRKFKTMEAENGLAGITKAPTGTIIAYATQPDATASDGSERNGLYTAELLKQIRQKDLTINQVFQNTRAEVVKKSANKQVPWELSSLLKDLYISQTAPGTISETPQSNPSDITAVMFGNLTTRAEYLRKPNFSPIAKQSGASGQVVVSVTIDKTGKVIEAKAITGHPLLRTPAEAAARQSYFLPFKVGNKVVFAKGTIIFNFINELPKSVPKPK